MIPLLRNLFTLTIATSLVACTSNKEANLPKNDELIIGISQEFETLNPLIMTMNATTYMSALAIRRLDNMNADAQWYPQLTKTVPSIENGQAKVITVGGKKKVAVNWEILEAAKWGDGEPVTCKDFELARTIAMSPNVSVPDKEMYAQVEKFDIDPKNPKKCTLIFTKARWDFNQFGNYYPVPSHLEADVFKKFEKEKEGYEKNSNYNKNPLNPGLYNGPYVVSELKLGDHVTYTPNPLYYGTAPKIKKIVIKLIPNTGTMEANLRSGTIDLISILGITFDQALAFEKKVQSEKLPYEVSFTPGLTYEHIDLNLDNPILKDIRVRKALLHGLDRNALTQSLFEGRQETAFHFTSPKDPWFTKDPNIITVYNYSKKEAEKLLDEAGWKIGADGLRMKDGKKLSLNFMTTAGNKVRETVQVFIQEQWKQLGVEIQIKNEPARVFFAETVKKRKFDLAMYAWVSSPESIPRSTLHSSAIPTPKNGWSGQNQMGWNNPRVDKLIEDLEAEFDAKKRLDLIYELQALYTKDVPVVPLYYRAEVSVQPKNIKNYKVTGHQFSETNQAEDWSLE